MRYTLINGLLLLAVSPFAALALPVDSTDPSDQPGQWDPNGQYRKGHYDQNGQFISNEQDGQTGYNQNGQYNNGQYNNGQYNNGQAGNYDGDNQWRGNNWDQNNNGEYNNDQNQNGHWQRRSVPRPFGSDADLYNHRPGFGAPGVPGAVPGIHVRSSPYDQNNQNQNGWTDANGQWHPNNQNQNQNGWTDANGQWHSTAKRAIEPTSYKIPSPNTDTTAVLPRSWWPWNNDNDDDFPRPCNRYDLSCPSRDRDDDDKDDHHRDDDYRDDDDDDCKKNDQDDHSGWSCRSDWNRDRATPTPRAVVARSDPNNYNNGDDSNSNYPQASPTPQNGDYNSYGNYKNYGSYQNYPNKDQHQDENLKATGGETE
ncbi:uncharacterized protein N7459_003517 [Penicillium hispanicum]|uniref:uncharacterized protein n=1 Tax=Penicillium hispanicum TaxID=1080232 RepID=UPI00253FF2E5|nr:uncharacterized protein N7459_003517 [Penicillium hispanicum]KAJ5587752.1 hypothetical protein N7459_003517 [Penicillium hispanicum]